MTDCSLGKWMATSEWQGVKTMAQKRPTTDRFAEWTWTDLQEWAGSSTVSRGRSYQRNYQVQALVCTPSGSLLAWVQGTQCNATQVEIIGRCLTSFCTCPVGDSRKHAVATVPDYLEHLKHKINCQVAEQFWQQEYAAADWQSLAEKLTHRLRHFTSTPDEVHFGRNYHHDRLTDWLIYSLEQAGQHDEIIPLCEHEAEKTYSYVRLVQHLKAANRREEAEQWIHSLYCPNPNSSLRAGLYVPTQAARSAEETGMSARVAELSRRSAARERPQEELARSAR
jgi:uncharacterized Zn finger protein